VVSATVASLKICLRTGSRVHHLLLSNSRTPLRTLTTTSNTTSAISLLVGEEIDGTEWLRSKFGTERFAGTRIHHGSLTKSFLHHILLAVFFPWFVGDRRDLFAPTGSPPKMFVWWWHCWRMMMMMFQCSPTRNNLRPPPPDELSSVSWRPTVASMNESVANRPRPSVFCRLSSSTPTTAIKYHVSKIVACMRGDGRNRTTGNFGTERFAGTMRIHLPPQSPLSRLFSMVCRRPA
jgi:hypothetical protein